MQTRLSFFIARTVFQTGTSKKLRSWGVSGLFRQDFKEKGAVGAVKDAVADAGDILIDGVSGRLDSSYEVGKPFDILWRSEPLRKTSIDRGGLAVIYCSQESSDGSVESRHPKTTMKKQRLEVEKLQKDKEPQARPWLGKKLDS